MNQITTSFVGLEAMLAIFFGYRFELASNVSNSRNNKNRIGYVKINNGAEIMIMCVWNKFIWTARERDKAKEIIAVMQQQKELQLRAWKQTLLTKLPSGVVAQW